MSRHQSIFASRVFAVPDPAQEHAKWYCLTREHILGPYASEHVAREALDEFVQLCEALGWNGDRDHTEGPPPGRIKPRNT